MTTSRPPFGRGRTAARVLAVAIDVAAAVGSRLPVRVAHALAVLGGNLEWALRPALRRRLAINLGHALAAAPTDRVVRRAARHEVINEARRSADLLWVIGRPAEFARTVHVDGVDQVISALAADRGLLLAGIHVGGWEVASALPRTVIPVATNVIVADNWLAWAIEHVRVQGGLRIIYRSRSAMAAASVLRRGEALLVLCDDAFGPTPRAFDVRFCGTTARLPGGIVALSRLTGAPIVPFDVLPTGPRQWRVRFGSVIAAPRHEAGEQGERLALQQLADHWTDVVRRHPTQWAARFRIAWSDGT